MKQPKPIRSSRSKPEPKAGYHHGDLPRALVAAAMHLIEKEGEHVTLRAAAVAAGVSVAAPYRHFESREALLAAVLAEGFRDLTFRTEEARRAAQDPVEAVVSAGVAYVRFAADRPRLYRLMFGPECDKASFPDLMQAGHESLGVLHHAVTDARASFGVDKDGVARIALTGWSLIHGFASLYVDGLLEGACTSANLDATTRGMVVSLIEGLRTRPTKPCASK
ncbi:TetR/AcrR family transcriptional regulator [Pseudomonas aeruginosa]|uniref:TetR/AcrR family transcriptional regulator n=1 Tax=Pseudomonas aeruginosa TaxID=287 RepID=UPI00067780D4|nr:TetR/AcrR family transcriptional regulator [Pseudomonas aeruginosa]